MGIPDKVMEEIEADVVDFAEMGAFIDAPMKTYSAGMRARLGFSIATAVDPDILLLDEVLSTGDEVFRAKSRQRIVEVLEAAKAVVMVTHDMNWVTEFCTRASSSRTATSPSTATRRRWWRPTWSTPRGASASARRPSRPWPVETCRSFRSASARPKTGAREPNR